MLPHTHLRQCPHCGSTTDHLQRSKRPLLYKLAFFVPSRAYRCYACGTKFIRLGWNRPGAGASLQ